MKIHLYIGAKTRCGKWITPHVKCTVGVNEVTCRTCILAYAKELKRSDIKGQLKCHT